MIISVSLHFDYSEVGMFFGELIDTTEDGSIYLKKFFILCNMLKCKKQIFILLVLTIAKRPPDIFMIPIKLSGTWNSL